MFQIRRGQVDMHEGVAVTLLPASKVAGKRPPYTHGIIARSACRVCRDAACLRPGWGAAWHGCKKVTATLHEERDDAGTTLAISWTH